MTSLCVGSIASGTYFTPLRRPTQHRLVVTASASASGPQRTAALRRLLAKPGMLLGPAAYDGISARLTEEAGFDFAFMSGFSVAGARLAKPDTGLLSYAEMLEQGRCMHEATRCIPIIGDGDTGYGNAMNVKRTVAGYAAAGFAGILIEDQQWPKSCGHVRGKRVVPRDEAIARVRAACDARDEMSAAAGGGNSGKEGSGIVIVARTDARQAESFQEALARAAAFADAGADVVFVDALETAAEMRTLCAEVTNAHKMANMLEGGGKTPILTPEELSAMGFKICAYPLSLLGVAINAQRAALAGLKRGVVPTAPAMPSFQELQAAVGFPEYFEEERYYAVASSTAPPSVSPSSAPSPPPATASKDKSPEFSAFASPLSSGIEPDAVIEPGGSAKTTVDLTSSRDEGSYSNNNASSVSFDRRSQWLRIKVSDAATGAVSLESRFPAGFLGTVARMVPQVAGVDLEGILSGETGADGRRGGPAFSFDADGERIEIFIEYQ